MLNPHLWLAPIQCSIYFDGSLQLPAQSAFMARSLFVLNLLAWLARVSCSIITNGSLSCPAQSTFLAQFCFALIEFSGSILCACPNMVML